MVDQSPQVFGVEKVDAIEVRDVHATCVGRLTVGAVLLYVESKETHLRPINLLKDKQSLCSIGKLLWEITLE